MQIVAFAQFGFETSKFSWTEKGVHPAHWEKPVTDEFEEELNNGFPSVHGSRALYAAVSVSTLLLDVTGVTFYRLIGGAPSDAGLNCNFLATRLSTFI